MRGGRIGMIVPSLERGGGVPAVARFVHKTAQRAGRYEVRLISLATSHDDPASVLLSRPASWPRGIQRQAGNWESLSFEHIGAIGGELEFQRYMPRRRLEESIGPCDVLQVVCGSPAWANAVIGLHKPVSLQVATRARVERRARRRTAAGAGSALAHHPLGDHPHRGCVGELLRRLGAHRRRHRDR